MLTSSVGDRENSSDRSVDRRTLEAIYGEKQHAIPPEFAIRAFSIKETARTCGLSRATIYRLIAER